MTRSLTLTLALALAAAAATGARAEEPPRAAPSRCLYVPPALEGRVVFYHSFERGLDRPEVNALGATFSPGTAALAPGMAGRGAALDGEKPRGPGLAGLALPLHKPLTVMMWWRLRAKMDKESGYGLVSLHGPGGYISNFVRSGPWCALAEPTFVVQVWKWQGISNFNGIGYGPGWVEADAWKHTALVVSKASNVRVFWDGSLRADVSLTGRTFQPTDVISAISLGPGSAALPMDIDEVMVLDVALDTAAVREYVEAVRHLAAAGFPP